MSPSEQYSLRIKDVALLAAFALFLSTIEYVIPKPVPYMRIGLANLSVLIGLTYLNLREYALLAVLKVLGQGIVHGTLFSYIFLLSAAGSFSSALVMLLIFRTASRRVSLIGISAAGAFASNLAQILLAGVMLFGSAAWLIAPPFLAAGLIASVVLGIFAEKFSRESLWLKKRRGLLYE